MSNKDDQIKKMDKLFDRLFPIARSITGKGIRKTLKILNEYLPLKMKSVKSGTEVLNWKVPPEWKINEAYIKGPNGKKIVDFKDNNLYVLNYSTPVDKKINLEDLKKHLYTIPEKPKAIPYVTSYYKRRWGFCLSHNKYKKLESGVYEVKIDSELKNDGRLDYGHTILPGKSEKEILLSTYVCHPSMANNELSGPIVAAFLYNRLKNWKNRRFTYRFVFNPETIGSITYLHKYGDELKEKMYSGMILTCLGGENSDLSYKLSRRENSPLDNVVKHVFDKKIVKGDIRDFDPRGGSDERQYCSPGFNLPVGQMARMVYGEYPGYHNSLDTKENMTIESLYQSVNEIEKILKIVELNGYYVNQFPYGEVKLGDYDLYPDINFSDGDNSRDRVDKILAILNYSDGKHSLLDIANNFDYNLLELEPVIKVLKNNNLLKGPYINEKNLKSELE